MILDDNPDTESVNGNEEPSDLNVVTLTGRADNCERAEKDLLSYLPITVQEPVPFEMHRSIIGKGGEAIRTLMQTCPDVKFTMSPQEEPRDYIELVGSPTDVEEARIILRQRIEEIEKDKEDRILRSFTLTVGFYLKNLDGSFLLFDFFVLVGT